MKEVFTLLSVLLFWGYQTANIELSFIMAAFLSFPILSNSKLKFTFPFFKFSVLISSFLLSIVVFYFISSNNLFFLSGVLKWLPLILLPIVALELYSEERKTPIKAFFIFSNDEGVRVKTSIYYIFTVVMASSSKIDFFYYAFVTCFIIVLLISIKPKRFNKTSFSIVILVLLLLSAGVQVQVSSLHKNVVDSIISFLMGRGNNLDVSKSSTRIGNIGDLKMSNKIIYRMIADKEEYPYYLREASYIKYFDGDWVAPKTKFKNIKTNICKNVNPKKNSKTLEAIILGSFKKKANIPLPTRTISIEKQDNKETYTRNSLMVINREGNKTDYIKFKYHKSKISCDKKRSKNDLEVPKNELKSIRKFIKIHKLSPETPPLETFKKLEDIFYNKFRYTLNLKKKEGNISDLGYFLLKSKAGHCEYFATATTLILRELGIPARYSVGFSVQEYSNWSKNFIIRQNHAHAWTRVFHKGQWYNFDTTPPDWNKIENQGSLIFRSISDFLSYISYKITYSYIWKFLKNNLELFIPFLFIIFIIIRHKNRNKRKFIKTKNLTKSKFLKKVDKYLKKKKIVRNQNIPIKTWIASLSEEEKLLINYNELLEIVSQYHIYRFSDKDLPKTRLKLIYKELKKLKKLKK